MSSESETSLACPKCGATMEEVEFEDVVLDRCTGCAGIWFDVDEHARLMTQGGSEDVDTGDAAEGRKQDATRDIDCPKCGLRMLHRSALKARRIDYEQCGRCHGAYFDAGEFTEMKQEKGFVDILLSIFSTVSR